MTHRFNLTVRYRTRPGREEFVFENFGSVSTDAGDPRFLPLVLERESAYVRVPGAMPARRPESNVTQTGSQRTVTWIDADAEFGLGRHRHRRRRHHRRARPEDRHLRAERADLFNLLCIPPLARDTRACPRPIRARRRLSTRPRWRCASQRRAMLIVDPDPAWATSIDQAIDNAIDGRNDLNLTGPAARNAALYFPLRARSSTRCATASIDTFVPVRRRSPASSRAPTSQRGVWKAPAGLDAALGRRAGPAGQPRPTARTASSTRSASTACARSRRIGRVVWGARTLRGADAARRRVEVRAGAAHSRCSSRRASTAARSGWCSSRTTSRCGRRSGSTSARSCTTCSARARSRARRRARPTSSSATARPRRRTTSTSASSTSSSASRRSSRPSSWSSRSSRWPARSQT